jgi:hypothetical protein
MANEPKLPPASSAGPDTPRRAPLHVGMAFRSAVQRQRAAAAQEPVEVWKRIALQSVCEAQSSHNPSPSMRFAHAAVSLVCVGGAGLVVLRSTNHPALFFVTALALFVIAVAMWQAFREYFDERAGVVLLATDAEACLRRDQSQQAVRLAKQALRLAWSERQRMRLWRTLAWAGISARDPFLAHIAIGQLRGIALDVHLVAAYLDCCNRRQEAIGLLREARQLGHRAPETTRLLIDLLFREEQKAEARLVAITDRALLTVEEWHATCSALE